MSDEYPKELRTATRAEYVTMIRTMKKDKKPGCLVMMFTLLFKIIFLILFPLWWVLNNLF